MSLTSLVQVIKVNELRTGSKDGRAWEMQDAECILLDDEGQPAQVGVLMLPKSMRGDNAPKRGVYVGAFSLQAGMRDRRIEAQLVNLTPYEVRKPAVAPSSPSSLK